MSLDDKFYPEDGTLLTRLDNTLIKAAGKVGEAYQHITGRSYKDLYNASIYSAVILTGTATALAPTNILAGLFAYGHYKFGKETRFESPLEERLHLEAECEPREQLLFNGPLTRLAITFGLPTMLSTVYLAANDAMRQDPEGYIQQFGPDVPVSFLFLASSFIPAGFAQYLSKANIPKPPEKHIFARSWEKMKHAFTPAFVPIKIHA